jgi:hypothetical protein
MLPRLRFLSAASMFLVLIAGLSVGVLGSYLAVRRAAQE